MVGVVAFWRRVVLGESADKAVSRRSNETLDMYVRCYFDSDYGRYKLAMLRLRREVGKALGLGKMVDACKRLFCRHEWVETKERWIELDYIENRAWNVVIYKCKKCSKVRYEKF